MSVTVNASIVAHFQTLEDPRIEWAKKHCLLNSLVIGLCTLLTGGERCQDMELFGKSKYPWLSTFFALPQISRSLLPLLEVVREFETQGIEPVSLRENIDTSTATGRGFLAIMGVISQMERELKAERTAAGRAAAKARGRTGGRPRTDPDKLEQARLLYLHSDKTAAEVCQTVGVGRRTLFSYLAQMKSQGPIDERCLSYRMVVRPSLRLPSRFSNTL